MKSLFEAKSIGIIGYSRSTRKWSNRVASNLLAGGYAGDVYLVNPNLVGQQHPPLSGKVVGSIRDVEMPIDCVFAAVSRGRVLQILQEAIECRAKTVVLPGVGFAELGEPEGEELQRTVAELCDESGLRVLGPNCFGIFSKKSSLNLTPYGDCPHGTIGFISQSGNIAISVQRELIRHGMGFSCLAGIGNQVNIGAYELIDYMAADDNTKVIGLYVEGMKSSDATRLMSSIAKCSASGKMVAVIKGGQTAAGSSAASSHTASFAGNFRVWKSALIASGAVCVDSVDDMCDFFSIARAGINSDPKIMVLADGGGDAVLATDAIVQIGLSLSTISDKAKCALSSLIPPDAPTVESFNPLILDTAGGVGDDPMILARCAKIAIADDGTDLILLSGLTGHYESKGNAEIEMIRSLVEGVRGTRVSVVVNTPYAFDSLDIIREFQRLNIPVLPSARRLTRALQRLLSRHLTSDDLGLTGEVSRGDQGGGIYGCIASELSTLLKEHGINCDMREVINPESAVCAFKEWGSKSVALKVADPHIKHKSDVGGVVLNLASEKSVRDAAHALLLKFPGGLTVMPMYPSGMELLVSVGYDPTFGRYTVVGQGGVTTELQSDYEILVGKPTKAKVFEALSRLRTFRAMQGFRGARKLDIGAIGELCIRLDSLAASRPRIEVEMNPVLLYPTGYSVADVLVSYADSL